MLILLSPAKTLDLTTPLPPQMPAATQPRLLAESLRLLGVLRTYDAAALQALMGLSAKLAELNAVRYQAFQAEHTPATSRPALFTFRGDVYQGLDAPTLDVAALPYAQQHVRILSGLYGLLRPLDLIQPHRLEMGTRLPTDAGPDLYAFWGQRIAGLIHQDLAAMQGTVVVNLASQEYFASVQTSVLQARVVTPVFKERRGNALQTIGLFAKRARGVMTRYAVDHRLTDPAGLQQFTGMGYAYDAHLSGEDTWVFVR